MLPFNRLLEKLAIMTVPDSPADTKQENSLLDDRLLATPSVAVGRAMLTGGDMAEICRTTLLQAMSTTRAWNAHRRRGRAQRTPSTITRTCLAPTWSN